VHFVGFTIEILLDVTKMRDLPLPLSSEDLLIFLHKFGNTNGSIRCNKTVSGLSDKFVIFYQIS